MAYIVHRGGDQRWVLQCSETGGFAGLMLLPFPGETPNAFAYDFGSTFGMNMILNRRDFPELESIEFFAIEYPGFHDFDRYYHHPDWQHLKYFLLADAKIGGYNASRDQIIDNPIPTLWQYKPLNPAGMWDVPAFALWVDYEGCYFGNRDGLIIAFNHQGEINYEHKLPRMARCLVGEENRLYSSCNDGHIYDLSGKIPQSVYNARSSNHLYDYEFHIFALDLFNNCLLLIDVFGEMTLLDSEFKVKWQQKCSIWRGWFLRCDGEAIYLGHSRGVNCYHLETGKLIWEQALTNPVLTGEIVEEYIFVGCSDGKIYRLNKKADLKTKQTEIINLCECEGSVYECSISSQGNYLFVADNQGNLYGFTITGNRLWKQPTGWGAVLALKTWQNRLYGVTNKGIIMVIDVSESAIISLENPPSIPPITSPKTSDIAPTMATDSVITSGVIVECFKKGSKLQVRVISSGYNSSWSVQFPSKLRQEGKRYLVEEIREAKQGGFYRACGIIRQLESDEYS